MLFLGAGFSVAGGVVAHTVFARKIAREIGWETNGFQYEVGFASLGIGLAAIYASTVDDHTAWVVGSIGAGIFLLLAHRRDLSRSQLRARQHGDPGQRPRCPDLALRPGALDGRCVGA